MTYCIDINKNSTNMIIKFTIDNNAPKDFIKLWKELKNKCETWTKNDCRKEIINSWLKYCKIETNKNLPFLDRCELSIGGNDNIKNKQIRFRQRVEQKSFSDNDIIIDQIYNTDYEKWTFQELHDIINAFKVYASNYINLKGGINGSIEFKINSEFNSEEDTLDDEDLTYKQQECIINEEIKKMNRKKTEKNDYTNIIKEKLNNKTIDKEKALLLCKKFKINPKFLEDDPLNNPYIIE